MPARSTDAPQTGPPPAVFPGTAAPPARESGCRVHTPDHNPSARSTKPPAPRSTRPRGPPRAAIPPPPEPADATHRRRHPPMPVPGRCCANAATPPTASPPRHDALDVRSHPPAAPSFCPNLSASYNHHCSNPCPASCASPACRPRPAAPATISRSAQNCPHPSAASRTGQTTRRPATPVLSDPANPR